MPVDDYLRLQKRYAHLFGAQGPPRNRRADSGDGRQEHQAVRPAGGGRGMTHEKTLRHHARPRLVAGQQDRRMAHRAPGLCRPAAALQPANARRARTFRAGSSTPRAATIEAAWRHLTRDNPFPAIMGRVCYHTCEGACNRGQARCGRRHQLGRAVSGRRGAEAGLAIRRARGRNRQACAGGRRRAFGPVGGLSSAPHGPPRDGDRGGRDTGRHDALWHSEIPPAARCA